MHAEPGKYYRLSGIAPLFGLLGMTAAGLATAIVLGYAYGNLARINPYVYLTIVAAFFFGAAMGWVMTRMGIMGKIRSGFFSFVPALMVGLVGIYAAWAGYFSHMPGIEGAEGSVWEPLTLLSCMQVLFEHGAAWQLKGFQPSGVVLALLWLAEAGVILVPAVMTPWGELTTTPFCEGCSAWMTEEKNLVALELTQNDKLKAALEMKRFEVLTLLPRATPGNLNCLHIHAHQCPVCHENSYITVTHDEVVTKGSETSVNTRDIVENLGVPAEVLTTLRKLPHAPTATPPAAPEKA